ncbi:Receptor-like serine/threonine-protein kinase SD1-8 [Zea mays]|uniref:Receptor-like serine/threonine-protein kinase n=1 Tax=Zea mays TaxID=4577 RepID=A0A3L6FGU1_MAIZE|nr:Receptor-like serine/threonine-protein kinase SD1-8 [Zea mays]
MRARTLSLLLLAAAASSFAPSASTDTIYRNTTLTGNQTLVSAGGIYALGFFSPAGAEGRTYLGIWYASIPGPTTVVWVANRRDPVVNAPAALQLSAGGRLVILDGNNDTVWSSAAPTVGNVTAAQLLDSGNLVLSADGGGQSVAWQSFDYPTDTLLPGMKLGVDIRAGITRNITAWRSPSDPSPGDVTFKLVIGGLPQFFLLRGATRVYTSGPWNGEILTGVPYLKAQAFTFEVVYSPDETYYSYFIREPSLLSRLVVDGAATQLKRFSLNNGAWNSFWYYPTDQCDYYAKCGPFGFCDTDRSPPCSCLPGFVPRSPDQWGRREWSGGCVRSTSLSCDGGDGFWVVNRMKLPQATDATVYAGMTLDQCRQACLGNCSCGAYAAANNSGGIGVGCVIWTVDLLDMRQYPIVVQDVYIRLAQSEIDALKAAATGDHQHLHKSKLIVVIVATISAVLFLLAAAGCCFFWTKKKKASKKGEGEDMTSLPPSTADFALPYRVRSQPSLSPVRDHKQLLDASEETRYATDKDVDLPLFELEVILAATDNFAGRKRIGAGGFGPVYMGVLEDGQQVAVKRLSQGSTQGVSEFMNEVRLIAKLQHRNLVRLLGCCIENDERMLVYEYMHNQSLDTFIFDEGKRRLLRWQKRFEIILGIARGLQYLHEDSRFRIIHRDLKASNVLLDRNMVPKISDFGIARMFGGDQTTAYTRKVVGTYGYMAPEYAMDGQISIKSDVFSFGVLVLEIITGRRNRGSYEPDLDVNLLGYAWMLWREGRSMELLDEALGGSFHHSRALRCIQLALLCVEAQPRNRPLMSSVVTMLASDNAVLPEPSEPGVNPGRDHERVVGHGVVSDPERHRQLRHGHQIRGEVHHVHWPLFPVN